LVCPKCARATHRPSATIGGDYYEFLPLPGDCLGLANWECLGQGNPGRAFDGQLAFFTARLALTHSGMIAKMLSGLKQVIYEASPVDRFVTLFCGIFDPRPARSPT